MDHSSEWSSQQTVRGVEAKCQLDPSVRPVTLQHKWITMLEPSRTTDHDTTTSTSTTALTSTPAPSTAAAPPPPPTAAAAPSSAEGPSTAATLPSVAAEAYFVGRKRALGEEGPIIILTQHEEDEGEGQSEQPDFEARSTSKLKKQEPTLILAPQPDEARSQLSTGSTPSDRGREPERRAGRAGYPPSDVSPKRDVSHVMQFFQEQEESLQASFLSLPKRSQKKQRSPSPHHMAGLEHLDHLIRLMEQLTSLKDENLRLRKRCEYLESTKVLLQAKRDLSFESSSSSSGLITAQTKHKHKHSHRHEQTTHTGQLDAAQLMGVSQLLEAGGRTNRPRLASAEELEYLELIDTTSDHRPKHRSSLHKRSFSTGSLHVESDHLTQVSSSDSRKRLKSKTARSIFSKTSASKQKSKSSKWARVKKVLTGQKLYEDLGTTIKSIREMGRPSHGRYSTTDVPTSPRDTSPRITNGDRRHSGASFARGTRGARAPPAQAPPSEVSRCSDLEEADLTSDLTSDIWMGPPDWWEEYEARKESGTSTASEVSSVIEVTTMYLGSKKEAVTTTLIPASTAPPASPSATGDHYLTVDKSLPRRQSSPSLSTKEGAEEEGDVVDELARTTEVRVTLHKSSSCKSADLEFSRLSDFSPSEGRQSKKLHKTAWGRVKDIIHTRKDSIRKRPKRSGIESEEPSEFDLEALMEERWHSQAFGEGLVGRSTPKTSPIVARQQSTKCDSPPGAVPKTSFSRGRQASTGHGAVDVAALLAGSVSEEFSKKMQQWETMRSQKSPFRASMDESDIGSMEVSGTSQDFNIRTVNLGDLKGKIPDSEGPTPEESNTSMEVLGAHSIHMEDIQRGMTDSFSRKMEEWERLKYKSISGARDVSPEIERKMSKSRKEERQKSKRSREEKEREKWERQRERDMQKVEREQMKLEKEKLRLEKERLRALEREAKLEKLKGRLSQSEGDSSFKNPVLSPLAEYKVTADFARKLHEWELKKGLCHDVSNSIYLEAQKLSSRLRTEDAASQSEVRPAGGRKAPPPLTLQPYWDSPEESSPIEKYSEASVGDGDDETSTSVTEEGFTRSNIATLERANAQLLETLHRKELEYASVQEEVQKVNEKLAKAKEEHAAEM
ncbi:uncharacterized protein LOC131933181, partial [Physella acuta]|uniref:uncharacterized protein LOC131933181 n=1 Tax=Physella acuta TaxID=109671 RepID=UPI0027DCC707